MDQFEKVEKLKQRANVSYEEALNALDACNQDLLDAMIYLERLGRTKAPEMDSFSTSQETVENTSLVPAKVVSESKQEKSFVEIVKYIWDKLKQINFVVSRKDSTLVSIPVWILLLVLIFFWWAMIIILVAGLFVGCHYSFTGPDEYTELNKAMKTASEVADTIKEKANEIKQNNHQQ